MPLNGLTRKQKLWLSAFKSFSRGLLSNPMNYEIINLMLTSTKMPLTALIPITTALSTTGYSLGAYQNLQGLKNSLKRIPLALQLATG